MREQIDRVHEAMELFNCRNVIYTGDIFHKWNSPPELVNFAIKNLPHGYSIPGNHDLPEHSLTDMHRSSYGTLIAAGILEDLKPHNPLPITEKLIAYGFPEGLIMPHYKKEPGKIHLAVVHDYCWIHGHEFPGAPNDKRANAQSQLLHELGFTAGVFGDNHKGFIAPVDPVVLNVGGFIRRNSDEKEEQPQMGIVYDDGSLGVAPLESKDEWEDAIVSLPPEDRKEIEKLMETLHALKSETVDYGEAVRQCLRRKSVPGLVRRILLRSLN